MATIATLRKSGNVESNQAFKGFPEGQMFTRKATITTPVLALNDVIPVSYTHLTLPTKA